MWSRTSEQIRRKLPNPPVLVVTFYFQVIRRCVTDQLSERTNVQVFDFTIWTAYLNLKLTALYKNETN